MGWAKRRSMTLDQLCPLVLIKPFPLFLRLFFHPRAGEIGRMSPTADGPGGLIADRVLADGVGDGGGSTDPRGPDFRGLDRRFHPGQRVMLLDNDRRAPPTRRRFYNVSTGEWIKLDVDHPELRDHGTVSLALTAGGRLVLLHKSSTHVQLYSTR